MANDKSKPQESQAPEDKKATEVSRAKQGSFYFPVWDVSVEAESMEAALRKLGKDEDFVKNHPDIKEAVAMLEEGDK